MPETSPANQSDQLDKDNVDEPEPVTSPADELNKLEQELEDKQNTNNNLAKDIDRLKVKIADLGKTVGDIDKKANAYDEKAAGVVNDQVTALKSYVETEKKGLNAALPAGTVKDIQDKKAAALQKLADLKTKLTQAVTKVGEADKAFATAKAATATAQAAYTTIADLPGTNVEIVKDLSGLRTAAEKQDAAHNLGRQYFLVLIMEDRLKDFKALTPEQYEKQLNEAGSNLAHATAAQATAKEASNAAVAAQKQAEKDLADALAKWRAETLESIPAGPPTGS
jgi:predicted  nucleic acid-binding Zn-ribbon protein